MTQSEPWVFGRKQGLEAKLRGVFSQPLVTYSFLPSRETDYIRYISPGLWSDLDRSVRLGFRHLKSPEPGVPVDILLITAHGTDLSQGIWRLREQFPNTLVITWMWDNHSAYFDNLRTAMASDFCFPSHLYAAAKIANPCAVLGTLVPACSAQWITSEAESLFARHSGIPRQSRMLVNYVDYAFSWRSKVLNSLAGSPWATVNLMPPGNRSRYFSKNSEERFIEWVSHKSSLLLPLQQDLSTRAFDALLAGQIIVVPHGLIKDFDVVFPKQDQELLDIVFAAEPSVDAIQQAAAEANMRFDRGGAEGARRRHEYARHRHMTVNRIESILSSLRQTQQGKLEIRFLAGDASHASGLYLC